MARYFRSQALPVNATATQIRDSLREVENQLMTEMVRITGGPISATSEDSPGVVFHGYEYDK